MTQHEFAASALNILKCYPSTADVELESIQDDKLPSLFPLKKQTGNGKVTCFFIYDHMNTISFSFCIKQQFSDVFVK